MRHRIASVLKRTRAKDVLLAVIAGLFVTTNSHVLLEPGRAVEARAEALHAAASPTARERRSLERQGRHLGFDTYAYPGDAIMRAWWHDDVPFEWVGYYLPAPCHKDSTWSGKRETLQSIGWGLAVIYVGQQAWEQAGTPAPKPKPIATLASRTTTKRAAATAAARKRTKAAARKAATRKAATRKAATRKAATRKAAPKAPAPKAPPTCASAFLSAERGRIEADDAMAKTEAEGFAPGTVIFLDIEYMTRTPKPMRDYYTAWTRRVLEDGRFRPGYYAHKRNADVVYQDVKPEFVARGVTEEPRFWIAGGRAFTPDREPHEVGRHFAKVWQGALDVAQKWNGYTLPIDVNVAHVPSPSTHEIWAGD